MDLSRSPSPNRGPTITLDQAGSCPAHLSGRRLAAWAGWPCAPSQRRRPAESLQLRSDAKPPGRAGTIRQLGVPASLVVKLRDPSLLAEHPQGPRGSRTPHHPCPETPSRARWRSGGKEPPGKAPEAWEHAHGHQACRAAAGPAWADLGSWRSYGLCPQTAGPSCVSLCVHVLRSSSFGDPVCGIRAT